jgi:hypothetical protein
MSMSRLSRVFASLIVFIGATAGASAQVGSGWTAQGYSKCAHYGGKWGGHYTNSGGVETFWTLPGEQRSEIMVCSPQWTSGQHQFQGEVLVTSGSGGTGGTSIQQVFGVANGNTAASQIRVYNTSGGTIRNFGSGATSRTLATGVYGRWERINVIHDANANRISFYVNGSLKASMNDGGDAQIGGHTHYFKYGVYLRSDTRPKAQWRNVKVFRK